MIEIKEKNIYIDGEPQLILCGEIHYFRLEKTEWQDRINKLKEAGCNAVATYVPWICHEPTKGNIDLTGETRPELDLIGYIDLCYQNGLYFIVKPGPFIMAEMKNEGLPYWIYEKYPEIKPIGWDGVQGSTPTVDYTHPHFLMEVKRWYEAIMSAVAPRLHQNGGPVIAIQLDNEVGMLDWVSNTPDLTDNVLEDFKNWLKQTYGPDELISRYPCELTTASIRSPNESYVAVLHKDLGYFMRNRFAQYIRTLREFAEAYGVSDVPFIVNIHGTGGGRGFTFPIGISQLYESYTQESGYISGSDIYFGDLNMETFQDLYLINGMMDAVHTADQPLTSIEFNCGDGNFGENYGGRYDPSAADLKARMCIAQGNRLLNYYLFAGGRNYQLDEARGDGNDRIAVTGERHGFAAPIDPEGKENYTFPRMAESIQTIMAQAQQLAVMKEERDQIAFGFIPDYFMTEYCYPNSSVMQTIYQNIEEFRTHGAWEIMGRALLLGGYRFTGLDLQNRTLSPKQEKVIVLPSARYMARSIQEKLVSYMKKGGNVLLYGEAPTFDMEGNPCDILLATTGVQTLGVKQASEQDFLSVVAKGLAAPRPEVRTHFAQLFSGETLEPIFQLYGTNEVTSFKQHFGEGHLMVIGNAYRCDIELFQTLLTGVGAKPRLSHDCKHHGLFMTSTKGEQEDRFVHVLNLDGFNKSFTIYENKEALFNGKEIHLGARNGLMLPLNVTYGDVKVCYATAEVKQVKDSAIAFCGSDKGMEICLQTNKQLQVEQDVQIEQVKENIYIVKSDVADCIVEFI